MVSTVLTCLNVYHTYLTGEMGYGASAKSTRFKGRSLGVIEKTNETVL